MCKYICIYNVYTNIYIPYLHNPVTFINALIWDNQLYDHPKQIVHFKLKLIYLNLKHELSPLNALPLTLNGEPRTGWLGKRRLFRVLSVHRNKRE